MPEARSLEPDNRRQRRLLCDTLQLPVPPRGMKRCREAGKMEEWRVFFLFVLFLSNIF